MTAIVETDHSSISAISGSISLSLRDGTVKHCSVFDPAPLVLSADDYDEHIEAAW